MGFIPQMPDCTEPQILFIKANSVFSYLNSANVEVIAHAKQNFRALNKEHIINSTI